LDQCDVRKCGGQPMRFSKFNAPLPPGRFRGGRRLVMRQRRFGFAGIQRDRSRAGDAERVTGHSAGGVSCLGLRVRGGTSIGVRAVDWVGRSWPLLLLGKGDEKKEPAASSAFGAKEATGPSGNLLCAKAVGIPTRLSVDLTDHRSSHTERAGGLGEP